MPITPLVHASFGQNEFLFIYLAGPIFLAFAGPNGGKQFEIDLLSDSYSLIDTLSLSLSLSHSVTLAPFGLASMFMGSIVHVYECEMIFQVIKC